MTWNPVTGCTKISPGCLNCYAERMAIRLRAMGAERYKDGFKVRIHPETLELPIKWKRPRIIFVNSMSDLFHEEVPEDFILKVFDTMSRCPQHTFQILTKRSARLVSMNKLITWPKNVWMGVSVEDGRMKFRIHDLLHTDARVKFLSCEPLIGPINRIPLKGIDWVIVGGESGPMARPMDAEWALDIRNECLMSGVPFFFKQWGGINKKATGRLLDGRIWNDMPSTAFELSA